MPRWPSLEEKRNRRADRPAESGKRCRAAGGAWPPDPSKHISTVPSTGKTAPPGAREGPRGRSANCGNGLFAQCVRLRSEINPVFSFLDFLTIPAAVVALHCFFAFIALPEGERPKRCVVTMLQALFGFGLSFVFTWAMKWVVAAFVLGWNEVFSNVLGEMGLWSVHGTSSLLPQADWPQVLKAFYYMSPQLFAICSTAGYAMISNVVCLVSFAAVLAIWIAVLVFSIRGGAQGGRRPKVLIQSLLMMLPLVVVLGYFVVMHDHAIVHIPVFGCKNWAIVFAMLFASGVSALRGLQGQKDV